MFPTTTSDLVFAAEVKTLLRMIEIDWREIGREG
jgi:hypothetical protein